MKLVNQRILVWLLGFLLFFSAAWVFNGRYLFETAAKLEEWNHQMKEFFGRTLNHQN